MLIPQILEVDSVGLKVSQETAVVACLFMVLGIHCIAVVCVIFSALSPSPCFGSMVIHFALCALVLLVSVLSSAWLSTTWLATLSTMTTASISATGAFRRSGGCISDVSG